MAATRICQRCGQPVSRFAPDGLCAHCLLDSGLDGGDAPVTTRRCAQPQPLPPGAGAPASEPGPVSGAPPGGEARAPGIRLFGDYELVEEIARGGMGVVYKARQRSLDRTVAVKMILAGQLASTAEVQRFRHEAEAAANLQHPNIVAIHEVGEHEGQHCFSMDFVERRSLAELVREQPLPTRRAAGYVKNIAEAIHYAHGKGVLHRDLKPSNVLIDALDQPRITDFGLAKRLTSDSQLSTQDSQLTLTGQVLGTPAYMSPEQASGKSADVGPLSDVYSLGAILYELVAGRPPFRAETPMEMMAQVVHAEPVSPRLLNPSVPRELETICLKCLAKTPGSRRHAADSALLHASTPRVRRALDWDQPESTARKSMVGRHFLHLHLFGAQAAPQ